MLPDHYATLGVESDADQATLRAAYLRIMRAHHPDVRPGDPTSADRARRANTAYAVLCDERRRAEYDRRRQARQARAQHGPASDATAARRRGEAAAYSPERAATQRSFTLASVRFAVTLFVVGLVLLLAFVPQ